MKNTLLYALLAQWVLLACATTEPKQTIDEGPIPDRVVQEIQAMAADDQHWEHLVMDRDPRVQEEGFFTEKQALQLERALRCREIFAVYGLPTSARVGTEAASDFWVLVQHADELVELQTQVLEAIQSDPAGAYNPTELAYLTDRVRINTGRPQLFGTQMLYDGSEARAYPKPLEDPAQVDNRRSKAQMAPLVDYVNDICKSHFAMNRAHYAEQGITKPYQYPQGFTDWE